MKRMNNIVSISSVIWEGFELTTRIALKINIYICYY